MTKVYLSLHFASFPSSLLLSASLLPSTSIFSLTRFCLLPARFYASFFLFWYSEGHERCFYPVLAKILSANLKKCASPRCGIVIMLYYVLCCTTPYMFLILPPCLLILFQFLYGHNKIIGASCYRTHIPPLNE